MDVSIVIPTKNAGKIFDKVLERIFAQKTIYSYEVICVDSGSTDNTLDIIKKYPCRLYEISPLDFGHGKTRNYGAAKGSGEYIVFITQDALPANDQWLQNFISAMKADPEIAGGFGKHLPYPECNVLDKRDLQLHFDGFGKKNTVYWLQDIQRYEVDEGYRHFLAFYSDNNSCMKREIWEKYPYDDVDFAEDQIWARKIIELGYKKLYCADAMVYHSHNYPLKTYYKRYYDEYKGLYKLHQYIMFKSKKQMRGEIWAEDKRDIKYIWDKENNISRRAYWTYYALRRNRNKCRAAFLAGKYHNYPETVKKMLDKRISQQYNQIHGEKEKMEKIRLNKEFWKWVFLRPKEEKREPILANVLKKNVSNEIDVCGFYDFVMEKDKLPFNREDYYKFKDGNRILNWVIPEMGPCSGGHINIFRFVKNLQNMGFENRIYIMNPVGLHTNQEAWDFLKTYYEFDDENIVVDINIKNMKYAHATIATSWITAYVVRDFDNTISKFYFVQDFEPYFYPLGSDYVFSENTYKFGFRGITAGDWLKEKLAKEYGMKTNSFGFSYDQELYFPHEKRDNVKRVFFYARPVTARRDFELGLLVLNKLTQHIPEVEVVFAGWDVSGYKIDFKHANFGTVKLTELSDLYAQCDLCLVLSNTNLSLLPLEVMASNSVVVCSDGENSTWLVNSTNSIIVPFDPDVIAEKMEYYLKNEDELKQIRENGLKFAQQTSWSKEAIKVKEAIEEGIEEDEEGISIRW